VEQPLLFSNEPSASEQPRPERIWLVDGHHLAYRSYFAFEKLSTSRGEPTQAIFGFLRTLLKLLKEDGDCVIVVFDPPTRTFRHEAFEEYKAGRAATPDDFHPQLEKIKELVDLMGLERLEVPGYEADDVIGTLAKKGEREGYPVQTQHLGEPIGWYVSMDIGQLNQIVHMWAYEDLADRARRRAAMQADPAWNAYLEKAAPLIMHMENKILHPAPFFRPKR
jgi:hypothetical protein